jgi:hypothetical protein
LTLSPYEIDYIITGADCHDIYHSLGNYYENSFFTFQPFSLSEFNYEVKVSQVYHPPQQSLQEQQQPPQQMIIPPIKTLEIRTQTSQPQISAYNSTDEYTPKRQPNNSNSINNPYYNNTNRSTFASSQSGGGGGGGPLIEATMTYDTASNYGLFEERAMILSSKDEQDLLAPSSQREDDTYEEDWSVHSKQRQQQQQQSQPQEEQQQVPSSIDDQQNKGSDNNEYDLDSFIVEDNDEEGVDSLTASPMMLDHHHFTHSREIQRLELQHKDGGSKDNHHQHLSPTAGAPKYSQQQSSSSFYEEKKEFIARKPALSKKHLKYYKQYSEKPIEFIDMLLHQALTIDSWADEGNQSLSESVLSPPLSVNNGTSAFSPRANQNSNSNNAEKCPVAFFSFILANGEQQTKAAMMKSVNKPINQ